MKKRKVALWERQQGKCFWCDCGMVFSIGHAGRQPANVATIDHLYTRYDLNRHKAHAYHDEERTVLACYECNHAHGALSYLAVLLRERRRRAGRG